MLPFWPTLRLLPPPPPSIYCFKSHIYLISMIWGLTDGYHSTNSRFVFVWWVTIVSHNKGILSIFCYHCIIDTTFNPPQIYTNINWPTEPRAPHSPTKGGSNTPLYTCNYWFISLANSCFGRRALYTYLLSSLAYQKICKHWRALKLLLASYQ